MIDMLQGMLAQWKREVGCIPDEGIWAELMAAAAHALGGLVAAHAGEVREPVVFRLVRQMGWALNWKDVENDLRAVRTPENAAIVDALLALHAEHGRRQKQGKQQPAPERDPGWEF
jgi:hypothetical protein